MITSNIPFFEDSCFHILLIINFDFMNSMIKSCSGNIFNADFYGGVFLHRMQVDLSLNLVRTFSTKLRYSISKYKAIGLRHALFLVLFTSATGCLWTLNFRLHASAWFSTMTSIGLSGYVSHLKAFSFTPPSGRLTRNF